MPTETAGKRKQNTHQCAAVEYCAPTAGRACLYHLRLNKPWNKPSHVPVELPSKPPTTTSLRRCTHSFCVQGCKQSTSTTSQQSKLHLISPHLHQHDEMPSKLKPSLQADGIMVRHTPLPPTSHHSMKSSVSQSAALGRACRGGPCDHAAAWCRQTRQQHGVTTLLLAIIDPGSEHAT